MKKSREKDVDGFMYVYARRLFFSILCLVLSFSFGAPVAAFSGVSAESAVLMEQSSGKVLYAKNPHQRMKIASITKIMTAILAIESGKMNKTVTISETAVQTEGSALYLKPGQKIKLEDLVYGLMLRSGNDAAQAIAEAVGGSIEGFVYMMNQKAEEIGMENTRFSNPHGLDGKDMEHYSSAYDMALLTKYAMQNPLYQKISGTEVYRAPNSEESWDYVWKNKNKLLTSLYEYSTGGKTGFTKKAGRTLVSTASKDGMDLIAVTIRDGDDWNDHMNLFNFAFEEYEMKDLLQEGSIDEINKEPYKGHVYIKNEFSYPLQEEEQGSVTVKYKIYTDKELENKEKVGVAEVYLGKEKIGERAIFYQENKVLLRSQYMLKGIKSVFSHMIGVKDDG